MGSIGSSPKSERSNHRYLVNNAACQKPAFVDTPETDVEKMLYCRSGVYLVDPFVLARAWYGGIPVVIINISSDGALPFSSPAQCSLFVHEALIL